MQRASRSPRSSPAGSLPAVFVLALVATTARADDAMAVARRARRRRRAARLRRHDRLPDRPARRIVAHHASVRQRPRVREAREPRRPGARGRPQPWRGALLLPGCEAGARRAGHVPQRVPVAVARAAAVAVALSTTFRVVGEDRVGGRPVQVVVFEPKDGLRYGHRFWSDGATGLLLKARVLNERGEPIEQFAFTDLTINAKIDRAMVEPSWPVVPPDWQVLEERGRRRRCSQDTGWTVARMPPGFAKIMEGFRKLRGRRERVAHLVYSDGLVSVSVFVEPLAGGAGARRVPAAGRPQRLQRQAGRPPDHRDGRNARRDRAPDRPFGRAPLKVAAATRRITRHDHHQEERHVLARQIARHRARCRARRLLPLVAPSPRSRRVARLLPDFTELYERQGPAVVSIDVTQKARRQRVPELSEDDPFYEFFRRFGQIPRSGPAAASSASSRRSRPARASSSRPTATSSPTRTSSTIADEVTVKLTDKREFKAKVDRRGQAHRRRAAQDRRQGPAGGARSAIPTSSRSANGWSRSASRSASRTR